MTTTERIEHIAFCFLTIAIAVMMGCDEAFRLDPIPPVEPAVFVAYEDPQSEPVVEKIVPTVIMHTTPGCGPCGRWKAQELPKWESVGWTVIVLPAEQDPRRAYPWYEITDGDGVKFESVGYMTRATFERDKQKAGK